MAPVYKIAIIQLQPKDVALEDNFARAEAFIRQAAAEGAHLAVLPEYHLTSWCPDHPDFVSACAASMAYLPRYQTLARELDINIVPGTICEVHSASESSVSSSTADAADANAERAHGADDKLEIRNMAYWIAATTGALTASYQKQNLWHTERAHLTAPAAPAAGGPASRTGPHTAFDTPLHWLSPAGGDGRPVRAGMLICWDLAFPEAFRALVADGAELVVIPSFWQCDGLDLDADRARMNRRCERLFIESALVARAFENECVVVFCNTGGASQACAPVYGPAGGVVLADNVEEMRVVEVDFGAVEVLEREYKVRKDMKREGWHYSYDYGKKRAE